MDDQEDYADYSDYSKWANKPGNLKGEAKEKFQAKQSKELSENERFKLETPPVPGLFYRSMSVGEYEAATKMKDFDFAAAFNYTNKDLYRWWVTSSQAKAEAFRNENVDSETKTVVVQFQFPAMFISNLKIKSHQEKGVQGMVNVVAMHREGFMTTKLGVTNMNTDQHVKTVLDGQMAFNLGFTVKQMDLLAKNLVAVKLV